MAEGECINKLFSFVLFFFKMGDVGWSYRDRDVGDERVGN